MKKRILLMCLLLCVVGSLVAQPPVGSTYPAGVQIRLHAVLSRVALDSARQQALAQYYLKEDSLLLAVLQADSTRMPHAARIQVQDALQAERDSLFTQEQRIRFYEDIEYVQQQSQEMSRRYRLASSDSLRIRHLLTYEAKALATLHATCPPGVDKETQLAALRQQMQDSISRVLVVGAYVPPETEYARILAYKKMLQLTARQIQELAQADAAYKRLSQNEKEHARRPFARHAKPVDYHQLWAFHQHKLTTILSTTQYLSYLRQANQQKAQAKAEQDWNNAVALGLTANQDSSRVACD